MAAIFALVFVPALAAVLFMLGLLNGGLTIATVSAALLFVALATGVFAGLYRMVHRWEEEPS